MSYEFIRHVLQYTTLINYIILIFWFLMFVFARPFLKHIHTQWFNLSDSQFDTINYAGIAIYKILVIVFNLVPLLALYIVGHP
ncbi:DUF6868 family protein [Acinetobacter sp. MB5]|uniref:DUF6868 family protein n=1 Tax=Acinetobacter sp. MB5 TaxID=2069438 RepID=UPI000DCF72E4|nr:hypothetical protein [Acinetobacter sp. MB5]